MGVGGWWRDVGGWGPPHSHVHAHAYIYKHDKFHWKWLPPWGNPWRFPMMSFACAHEPAAPPHTPHIPIHPPAHPQRGPPKSVNLISFELIEIIQFCLKILNLWRLPHLWVGVWMVGLMGGFMPNH